MGYIKWNNRYIPYKYTYIYIYIHVHSRREQNLIAICVAILFQAAFSQEFDDMTVNNVKEYNNEDELQYIYFKFLIFI